MKLSDLLSLHFDMHDKSKQQVKVGSTTVRLVHVDKTGNLFTRAEYQDCTMLTQNLRKSSSAWTSWVKDHTGGKITWVTKNNQYVGRVESSQGDDGVHIVVRSFNPDSIIFDEVVKDEQEAIGKAPVTQSN